MKKVTFLLLALVLCYAASAQKITFRLNAAGSYGLIPDFSEELLLDMSLPPGTPFYTIPTYQPATWHTRFKEKAGAKLGGTIGVLINPNFSLETGLLVNLVRFQKTEELTFPDAGTGAGTGTGTSGPVLRRWQDASEDTQSPTRPVSLEPDSKAGNTAILYLDIPLNVRYNLYKFIDIKAGFTTSQLVYAERYLPTASYSSNYFLTPPSNFRETGYDPTSLPVETQPSYTKYKSGNSFNKTLFALTTGITLKATKHLGFDLDYARYLTPIYISQAEKHPHKYNMFSTGMSYAF